MADRTTICLTFDIDLVAYAQDNTTVDEFTTAMPALFSMFDRHPDWVATWFIRLDDQIATLFGAADAIFERHAAAIARLRDAGHEIGWHPHAYARNAAGAWIQNTNALEVADELTRLAPLALSRGLQVARTGWGFHSNETMTALADAGVAIDSSAMPRPRYAWELSVKDWTTSPTVPYHPSVADYRVPGEPALPILEVPMSVATVRAANDTEVVRRYINPSFYETALRPAIAEWFSTHDYLVTITHPYELVPAGHRHDLISYDVTEFERNITALEHFAAESSRSLSFATLSQFASSR